MTHPLAIAAQTLALPPNQMVEVAARAGFEMVGFKHGPDWSDDLIRALRGDLDASGVSLLDIEALRLVPDVDWGQVERLLDAAASLGAANVLVVGQDPDRAGVIASYARACEMAGQRGLRAALEPMPFRDVVTLADALEVIAAVDHPAAALLLDNHHLARSGGSPADLARVPSDLIPYAQICDAPAEPLGFTTETLMQDALTRRCLPGDGALPLAAFVAALPAGTPLSVEILTGALRDAYPSPLEYARAIRSAATSVAEARSVHEEPI